MAVREISGAEFEAEVLKHDGTVLVDFFADWCGPCKWLAPLLDRFSTKHGDVKIVKLDVDAAENIAEQYGVKKIPTLLAFREGQEVRRAINPQSNPELEALIAP
jgi:thioredoxin 1